MTDISGPQQHTYVVSYPPGTYPDDGTFGYPTDPDPYFCDPPPRNPPTVDTGAGGVTADDPAIVEGPQGPEIPLDVTSDVWITINGTGFTPLTELEFTSTPPYNHQWPVTYVSSVQIKTLITPANAGGNLDHPVTVCPRNGLEIATQCGSFLFTQFP